MPQELSDVLHYLIPELGPETGPATGVDSEPAAVSLAVPVPPHDLLRCAWIWNLAVELARQGVPPLLVVPPERGETPAWPGPGTGPLGLHVRHETAPDLPTLAGRMQELARLAPAAGRGAGLLLVPFDADLLTKRGEGEPLLRRVLLLTTPAREDVRATAAAARCVLETCPGARVGVTVHGVTSLRQAESAFFEVADPVERALSVPLWSYGVLADDLPVYRSIVSQRPLCLTHAGSASARSLEDVAGLLLADLEPGRARG